MPSVKAIKPKEPTFPQKVKALIPPGKQKITVPYSEEDVEMLTLLSSIKSALKKKYGGTYEPAYKNSLKTVITNANKAPDATKYLAAVLKIIDPKAKSVMYGPKTKVKPGEFYGLKTPDIPLSTTALKHTPNLEIAAKKKALEDKIAAYEAEIQRLKTAQEKAYLSSVRAEQERKKLGANIDEKLLKYFSYIEKHCSKYLKSVTEAQKFLYRGQDEADMPIFIGYPRADRKPMDSDPEAQKLADKYLKILGFKALRSNSIFTTANFRRSGNYGTVYAIFPKNGFDFLWSTKYDDLVLDDMAALGGETSHDLWNEYNYYIEEIETHIEDLESYLVDNFKEFDYDTRETDNKVKDIGSTKEFKKLWDEVRLWSDDINKYDSTIDELHDYFIRIMNAYDKAAAKIPYLQKIFGAGDKKEIAKHIKDAKKEAEPGDNVTAELKPKAVKATKSFGFTDKDLTAAIKSEHEVCIHGEYIAVDYYKYGEELQKYFLSPVPKKVTKKPTTK